MLCQDLLFDAYVGLQLILYLALPLPAGPVASGDDGPGSDTSARALITSGLPSLICVSRLIFWGGYEFFVELAVHHVLSSIDALLTGSTFKRFAMIFTSGQGITVALFPAWPIFYGKVVMAQYFQPSGDFPPWFFRSKKPYKCLVVTSYFEPPI